MAQRICPNCNHIENEYTYFCTDCGTKTIEYSGSTNMDSAKVNSESIEEAAKQFHIVQPVETEIHQPVRQEITNQDFKGNNTVEKQVEYLAVDENVQDRHIEYAPQNNVGRTADSQNQNNKNSKALIIGLTAIVGVLLIVVIVLAKSGGERRSYGTHRLFL